MPKQRMSLIQRISSSRLALFVGGAVFLCIIVAVTREMLRRYELHQEITSLQQEMESLESQKSELSKLIDYFGSPLFQEQEGREKLGLSKPGEHVVIVPLDDETRLTTNTNADRKTEADPKASNPQEWWRFFFGKREASDDAASPVNSRKPGLQNGKS